MRRRIFGLLALVCFLLGPQGWAGLVHDSLHPSCFLSDGLERDGSAHAPKLTAPKCEICQGHVATSDDTVPPTFSVEQRSVEPVPTPGRLLGSVLRLDGAGSPRAPPLS